MKSEAAEVLKKYRELANLSQKQVSDEMGYSTPQFISNWERGVSRPPKKDVRKICRIIKCDVKVLAVAMLNDYCNEGRKYYRKFFDYAR